MNNTTFAQNLKARRKELGLTRDQLALRAKIHVKSIASFEEARAMPDTQKLSELCKAIYIEDAVNFTLQPFRKEKTASKISRAELIYDAYTRLTDKERTAVNALMGIN